MKRLYTFLALSCVLSIYASEGGWQVNNSTDRPIASAWYKAKISLGGMGYYAWGDKEKIKDEVVIQPGTSQFIALPAKPDVWGGYNTRRELVLTFTGPDGAYKFLQKLAADNSGVLMNNALKRSLFITDKNQLGGYPYKQGAPDQPIIFLLKDQSTQGFKAVIEDVKSAKASWNLENKSGKPIFYAWYEADWNKANVMYTNPQLMGGQAITQLAAGSKISLAMPLKQMDSGRRYLMLSFDAKNLKRPITSKMDDNIVPDVSIHSRYALGDAGSNLTITKVEDRPLIETKKHVMRLINTTNKTIYGALYYVDAKEDKATRASGELVKIDPQMSVELNYPLTIKGKDIQLFVGRAPLKNFLEMAILTKGDMTKLTRKSFKATNVVNWYRGQPFNIVYDVKNPEQHYLSVSSAGGTITGSVAETLYDFGAFDQTKINKYEAQLHTALYEPSDAIKKAASSQDSTSIIDGLNNLDLENRFIKDRTDTVRKAINELFQDKELIAADQPVPKIAIAFTGGGYRAMIETIGFLSGAEKQGFLDTFMYMSGLSGSTWAINPLVVSGKSPREFAAIQQKKVTTAGTGVVDIRSLNPLIKSVLNDNDYTMRRFVQSRYNQYYGPIGVYGHAISQTLLNGFKLNNRTTHDIRLSDLRTNLLPDKYPLPLSVAVDQGRTDVCGGRLWVEFSPFYIGVPKVLGLDQGRWIDTELFGCTYKEGNIRHFVPEYPLAQYMGIWGSAFAVTAQDIARSSTLGGYIASGFSSLGAGAYKLYDLFLWKEPEGSACPGRITAGQIPNFSFEDKSVKLAQLRNEDILCLVDGGMVKDKDCRHNFSTIPPLARDVDILILCDTPEHPNADTKSKHLMAASQEAQRLLGIDFPGSKRGGEMAGDILEKINSEVSTLLLGNGKQLIVVYMKGKKLPDKQFDPDSDVSKFTTTANFDYSPKEFAQLVSLTEAIMSHKTTVANIKEAIKVAVDRMKA